jgi:hypothetical protein
MDGNSDYVIIDDEIRATARHALYYTNLLIKQCDSWLSEEEGLKNVEMRIQEREKAKRKENWKRIGKWWFW